jgi:hypothetical protein
MFGITVNPAGTFDASTFTPPAMAKRETSPPRVLSSRTKKVM